MTTQNQQRLAVVRQALADLRRDLMVDDEDAGELVEFAERRLSDCLRVCSTCGESFGSVAAGIGHERREPGHKTEAV